MRPTYFQKFRGFLYGGSIIPTYPLKNANTGEIRGGRGGEKERRYRKVTSKRKRGGKTEKEMEYEEMKRLGEKAGIEDLMSLYGEYQKWMQISMQYLKEMDAKFTFSTTDSTS